MKEDLKCYIGMHRYKIHAEETMYDVRGNVVGKIIISVCDHCGKVKAKHIKTVSEY